MVNNIRKMFGKVLDWGLDKSRIFGAFLLTVKNLTKAVQDLTHAYTILADEQKRHSELITDLCSLCTGMLEDQAASIVSSQVAEPKRQQVALTPLETLQAERKKKIVN